MTVLVSDLQTSAQTYASHLGDTITSLVNALTGMSVKAVTDPGGVSWAGHTFLDGVTKELTDLLGTKPENYTPTEPGATPPDAPTLQDITAPKDVSIPDFTATPPSVAIPSAPSVDPIAPPGEAPSVTPVTLPDAPSFVLPSVPTLADLNIPSAPSVTMPTFTGIAPDDVDLQAPSNTFAYAEQPYVSQLLDQLNGKLLDDLENGGYGIETADEIMLLDRAVERENTAAERAIDDASRDFAARRFDLPPGALLDAIGQARENLHTAANTLNREIVLKRYDLFVQARQFAIQQGISLENIRMTFHGAMMERFLNAARYMAEAAVSYFNLQVEAAKFQLEKYESETRVFETLMRAKVEEVQVFRAQIEAEQLRGQMNQQRLEQFRAQLDGLRLVADIYNTRLRGVELQQDVEKRKLDIYRSQIEAYIARVHGQEIKFALFDAQVRGERAKVELYGSQASAYDSVIRGKAAQIDVSRQQMMAVIERNRGTIDAFDAKSRNYRNLLDKQIQTEHLKIEGKTVEWRGFEARGHVAEAMGRLAVENYRSSMDDLLGVLRHNLEKAKFLLHVDESNRAWSGDVIAKSLSFYTPLASAALSSINTLGVQTATS